MSLNVVMLGPPGAGKGTQAERLARIRGIPRVSTGDILREAVSADSDLGRRVKGIMDRGELVGDDVMTGIVRERLDKADARAGFILDGFPRTVAQAEALDRIMDGRGLLLVMEILVPEAELVRRLGSRMICASCGHNAGDAVSTGPGAEPMVRTGRVSDATAKAIAAIVEQTPPEQCRLCGGVLVQRADDNQSVVLERLKVYHRQTEPLVEYYRDRPTFRQINGVQTPDCVAAELALAVDAVRRGGLGG